MTLDCEQIEGDRPQWLLVKAAQGLLNDQNINVIKVAHVPYDVVVAVNL